MKRGASLFLHAANGVARRGNKAFALGGGLALSVALVAAVLFLTDALRADVERARSALPDVVVQRLVGGRPSILLPSDAKKLDGIDSVTAVRARVWGYVFVPALQGNVTVIGAAPGAPSLADVRGALDEGRDLLPGTHEMIAGKTLARAMGLVVGDELGLPSASATNATPAPALKLVGTFGSAVDLYAADVVLCDESDARTLLGLEPDAATDLALTVSNPAESRVVAGEVLARLPGTRVVEKDLLGRVYALTYGRRSGLVLAVSLPALLALLVLAWDRASGLGPEEKREIAILKAVGFSTKDVLLVKMVESLLVASAAAAVGLALGYAWVFLLGAPGLRHAIVGWSVLYPDGPLTPAVDLAQLVAIAVAVVAPFVGLSIVPAWRAASMDPMEAMRS